MSTSTVCLLIAVAANIVGCIASIVTIKRHNRETARVTMELLEALNVDDSPSPEVRIALRKLRRAVGVGEGPR